MSGDERRSGSPDARGRSRSRSRSPKRSNSRGRSRSNSRGGAGGAGGDSGKKQEGTVARWHPRGFGFIKPADGGEDIFVHVSSIKDGNALKEGGTVTFTMTYDERRGKQRADNVYGGFQDDAPPPRRDERRGGFGGGRDRYDDRRGNGGYGGGGRDRYEDRRGGGGGYGGGRDRHDDRRGGGRERYDDRRERY